MIIKLADAIKWIEEHPRTEFRIKFKKVDGTVREMRTMTGVDDGTLVKNVLKKDVVKPNPNIVNVYDLDIKKYRSFRKDQLLSICIEAMWQDIEETRIVQPE